MVNANGSKIKSRVGGGGGKRGGGFIKNYKLFY